MDQLQLKNLIHIRKCHSEEAINLATANSKRK